MARIRINAQSQNTLAKIHIDTSESMTDICNRLINEHVAISEYFKQDKETRPKRIRLSAQAV